VTTFFDEHIKRIILKKWENGINRGGGEEELKGNHVRKKENQKGLRGMEEAHQNFAYSS
jgi:hypothetical protein